MQKISYHSHTSVPVLTGLCTHILDERNLQNSSKFAISYIKKQEGNYKERKTTCMYVLWHSKNMINFEAFRHLIKHKPLISEVCSSINLKKSYLVLS